MIGTELQVCQEKYDRKKWCSTSKKKLAVYPANCNFTQEIYFYPECSMVWKKTYWQWLCLWLVSLAGCEPVSRTTVSIEEGNWYLNGQITNPGTALEGKLMNVRMVNATFEDALRPDYSFQSVTQSFLASLPAYREVGIRAITLNLQGGFPGYEGAVNSAFNPDGSLRKNYLHKLADVLRACDIQGVAVILGCFYHRQDQFLSDSAAVHQAVVNTAQWLKRQNFRHVLLEIADEYPHKGYDHPIIRNPETLVQLMDAARQAYPGLLVSASGMGSGRLDALVADASDFILVHFEDIPHGLYASRIQVLKKYNKPIVCNKDEKTGEDAARALQAAIKAGCSWGYLNAETNQHFPFEFKGLADDRVFYAALERALMPLPDSAFSITDAP